MFLEIYKGFPNYSYAMSFTLEGHLLDAYSAEADDQLRVTISILDNGSEVKQLVP